MSAEATGWVWRESPYEGERLLVHLAIADVVNDAHDNEFWMGVDQLAQKARVSRSTVQRTLADMVARDLLVKLTQGGSGKGQTSHYRFPLRVSPGVLRVSGEPRKGVTSDTQYQETKGTEARVSRSDPKDLGERTSPPWVQAGKSWSAWNREQLDQRATRETSA